MNKVDLRLSRGQLGPLQVSEGESRKENLAYERAGEEGTPSLESVQDKGRAEGFSAVEFLFANSNDRRDFCKGGDSGLWSDPNGSPLNILHVPFNFAMIRPEPDMLQSTRCIITKTRPR